MEVPEAETPLPPAMFISGHLGLDFLNSIATPVDEIVEWIGTGRNYLSWLGEAGLLTAPEIAKLERQITVRELNEVAAEARTLREWFRGFVMAHRGHQITSTGLDQLRPLIRILDRDELSWALEPEAAASAPDDHRHGAPLQLRLQRRYREAKSLLRPVAEQLAKLVCSPNFQWIKACEGSKCTLLMLDLTRRRTRRWCSMTICGNRAKQAAHRKRTEAHRK